MYVFLCPHNHVHLMGSPDCDQFTIRPGHSYIADLQEVLSTRKRFFVARAGAKSCATPGFPTSLAQPLMVSIMIINGEPLKYFATPLQVMLSSWFTAHFFGAVHCLPELASGKLSWLP